MIRFEPMEVSCINRQGESILDSASEAGVEIISPCGGNGTCGKCRVKLLVGEVNEVTPEERAFFTEEELAEGWRLACRTKPKNLFRTLEVEVPVMEKQAKDDRQLLQEYTDFLQEHCLSRKRQNSSLEKIETEDRTKRICGIAVDIGTTNVEALLWDLQSGECLAGCIQGNALASYGGDVVSRITYAIRAEENFGKLCKLLQGQIKDMCEQLLEKVGKEPASQTYEVAKICVAANSAMMHFFAEEPVDCLAKAPYHTTWKDGKEESGEMLGFPEAKLLLLPNIESFVGADTVAVLTCLEEMTDLEEKPGESDCATLENCLVIDIGTNGEIAYYKDGLWHVTSTAAGPAFEGASISCGMRAEEGAILKAEVVTRDSEPGSTEGVSQKKSLHFTTKGEKKVRGICGSGLISVVNLLRQNEVLDETGYLLSREKAEKQGCDVCFLERLRTVEQGNVFVLGEEKDSRIWLAQQDIRELQLAKAAIFTGVKLLLSKCGSDSSNVRHCYLAGAFGKHLDLEAAEGIGLLPQGLREKCTCLGNGSLLGASMVLENEAIYEKRKEQWRRAEAVSLSDQAEFQTEYLSAVNFS